MIRPLPKKVMASLTPAESKKLEELVKKHKEAGVKMIEAQEAYTVADRSKKVSQKMLEKMAEKGMKAEFIAFGCMEKLTGYMEQLYKKYN